MVQTGLLKVSAKKKRRFFMVVYLRLLRKIGMQGREAYGTGKRSNRLRFGFALTDDDGFRLDEKDAVFIKTESGVALWRRFFRF